MATSLSKSLKYMSWLMKTCRDPHFSLSPALRRHGRGLNHTPLDAQFHGLSNRFIGLSRLWPRVLEKRLKYMRWLMKTYRDPHFSPSSALRRHGRGINHSPLDAQFHRLSNWLVCLSRLWPRVFQKAENTWGDSWRPLEFLIFLFLLAFDAMAGVSIIHH